MEGEEDQVKKARIVEARARNISHNVRCTECGSQSIEDAQADIAILLRKLIRDEIRAGKYDKEIYKKLEEDFAETVLYSPRFDIQTAAIWLSLVVNFFVGLLFLRLLEQLGAEVLYSIFAFFCLLAAVFMKRNVVETKGKSLQEIEVSLLAAS
ncbi:Cytochrome c-type biogenesis CcmH-like protein [Nymphaea thermarum]|nr:Cytochrome c-type biogenesis CcmH-like protein [Nymphaea thermarum]